MSSLKEQQDIFAEYVLKRKMTLPPYLDEKRVLVYRNIIFGNIERLISSSFPILKSFFQEENWQQLIQGFILDYQCQTPYFADIAFEFYCFFQQQKKYHRDILYAILDYEYSLLALNLQKASLEKMIDIEHFSNVFQFKLYEVSQLKFYHYPVNALSSNDVTQSEQDTWLLLYRHHSTYETECLELNALTYQLLSIIKQFQSINFEELVSQFILIEQDSLYSNEELNFFIAEILLQFIKDGIIRSI